MRLSVIIPTRNGGPLLARHLPEIVRQAAALPGGAEVLIVDDLSDHSGDDTAAVVAAAGPIAHLLRSDVHRGFAGTCNLGAQHARGEFLLFLNNDMRLEQDCLPRLVALLTVRQDLFAISPTIVNAAQRFVESTTRFVWRRGALDVLFPGREGDPGPGTDRERSVAYACGGAMLCRRQTFLGLGQFCERMAPFYWEDAELGMRAWAAGLGSVETGAAHATHDHAQTIGARYSPREVRVIYERNRLLLIWLHLDDGALWALHICWLLPRWLWALVRRRALGVALPQALARWREIATLRRARRNRVQRGFSWKALRHSGRRGWPPE